MIASRGPGGVPHSNGKIASIVGDMGLLVSGEWKDEWYDTGDDGAFKRPDTRFRSWVRADGSTEFAPEAGRYHLYVSYACPWAHRTLIAAGMLGLNDAIGVTVVSPKMGESGWELTGEGEGHDPVNAASFLHEVYTAAKSDYTGRVTVPVLWDKKTNTIVNNESREILRMFTTEFRGVARHKEALSATELTSEVDRMIDANYDAVNNGVYRAGFATTQQAYDNAVYALFERLDELDELLGSRRYLLGDKITEADICLFTTLIRFDPVYVSHFKCNLRRVADYPNIAGYVRELYQMPEVARTVHFDHIKTHYFWSHTTINPHRIVAAGPVMDLGKPHGRGD